MYITVALELEEDRDRKRGMCTGVSSLLLRYSFFFFLFVGNFALIGSPAQDGGALFVGAPID